MYKITELQLAAYLRARAAGAQIYSRLHERERDERGSSTTETVLIIAGLAVLALTVLAVIGKKVLDKADSISF